MMNCVLAATQREQQLFAFAGNEIGDAIPVEVGLEKLEGRWFGEAWLLTESVVLGAEGGLRRGDGCERGRKEETCDGDPEDGHVGILLRDVGLKSSLRELPLDVVPQDVQEIAPVK